MSDEFVKALESVGARNVDLQLRQGAEQRDSILFEIGDRYFMIDSGRGGNILKGSYLKCETGFIKDITKEMVMDTVTGAGMKAAVKDRRKRTFVRAGLTITFTTDEQYTLDHYVKVPVKENDRRYPFKIYDIEATDDGKLQISAVETGYWAKMLGNDKSFDCRTMLGREIIHVTDAEEIRGIKGAACLT